MMDASAVDPVRHGRVPPYSLLVAGLAILVVILMGASLAIGYAPLDLVQAFRDVFKGEKTLATLVLTELRLPRALLGCFVGLSLGISGAAMQGLLRNPLAEPGIIGVSGAAAFGAVTVFYFGLAGALSANGSAILDAIASPFKVCNACARFGSETRSHSHTPSRRGLPNALRK